MSIKSKKEAKEIIECLIKSCEEGIDGTWDCSTDEGKEGFDAMVQQLEELDAFLETRLTYAPVDYE